jgi:hypothetical protein
MGSSRPLPDQGAGTAHPVGPWGKALLLTRTSSGVILSGVRTESEGSMRHGSAPRLTAAHVAKVHREVPEREVPSPHRKMVTADQEAYARHLLDELGTAPFWVFAYGSLIWKPAFDHVEARTVHLAGWRRRFCLKLTNWRATPEQPGLMLALDRGGSCVGVAYRMPQDAPLERMVRLLQRETSHHEDMRWQRWVTVRSGEERFRAAGLLVCAVGACWRFAAVAH